uniref:Uncharacterized protein n=1 Tax=Solanum lycopersicum TaxID=4081 RepID=A0A3Q7I8G2_SOLLC
MVKQPDLPHLEIHPEEGYSKDHQKQTKDSLGIFYH